MNLPGDQTEVSFLRSIEALNNIIVGLRVQQQAHDKATNFFVGESHQVAIIILKNKRHKAQQTKLGESYKILKEKMQEVNVRHTLMCTTSLSSMAK